MPSVKQSQHETQSTEPRPMGDDEYIATCQKYPERLGKHGREHVLQYVAQVVNNNVRQGETGSMSRGFRSHEVFTPCSVIVIYILLCGKRAKANVSRTVCLPGRKPTERTDRLPEAREPRVPSSWYLVCLACTAKDEANGGHT